MSTTAAAVPVAAVPVRGRHIMIELSVLRATLAADIKAEDEAKAAAASVSAPKLPKS